MPVGSGAGPYTLRTPTKLQQVNSTPLSFASNRARKGGGFYFRQMTLWFAPEAKWFVKKQWTTGVGGANVWENGVSELQSFSLN